MNNIIPELQKCWTQKNYYSQPSTLPKEALAKSYFSTSFGLSFMISSVTPTRSPTFYAYLGPIYTITNTGKLEFGFGTFTLQIC